MPFLSLSVFDYRNLQNGTMHLDAKEVYFVGENGQGKSNLLEALYYASYGTSFRKKNDMQVIAHGKDAFRISALYQQENNDTQKIQVTYDGKSKRIEKNGKRIHDRKELINTIPCVLFCHDDLQFAVGEPGCRRFFIDQSLSLYDAAYIDTLRNFQTILKNRNIVLKERHYHLLDVYNRQFAESGLAIQQRRKNIIFEFNQIFGKLYEDIAGIADVRLEYRPSWREITDGSERRFPCVDDVINVLNERRGQDIAMETTMTGPQRDKIIFMCGKEEFISTASMGQRRLVVLLLRVAQALYYTQLTGKKPVLLMDDALLELDLEKREKLTALLPTYDQLICTFLSNEPYERYRHRTTKVYHIAGGMWYE
ncbi:MAG: DNA replication/repair protein RecF [Treponema sp.]|nr:DNA replication/repair protein RecF [Treponema sp.]